MYYQEKLKTFYSKIKLKQKNKANNILVIIQNMHKREKMLKLNNLDKITKLRLEIRDSLTIDLRRFRQLRRYHP